MVPPSSLGEELQGKSLAMVGLADAIKESF